MQLNRKALDQRFSTWKTPFEGHQRSFQGDRKDISIKYNPNHKKLKNLCSHCFAIMS